MDMKNQENRTKLINMIAGKDLLIKELQHYKDTTVGLWATDRPDLIQDTKKILFQLK